MNIYAKFHGIVYARLPTQRLIFIIIINTRTAIILYDVKDVYKRQVLKRRGRGEDGKYTDRRLSLIHI